jgi:hypothetical protein
MYVSFAQQFIDFSRAHFKKISASLQFIRLCICVFCRMIPVCMNTGEHHVWPAVPFCERNLDVSSDPLTQTRLHTFANATQFQIILIQISHYW